MYSGSLKPKTKIDLIKCISQLSQVLPSASPIRESIQNNLKDMTTENIDIIHKTLLDKQQNKKFIGCNFNINTKNPKTFRSPYTNRYFPLQENQHIQLSQYENATYPTPILRHLQEKGNILFQQYARLYYGQQNCIANFYVSETEQGLNAAFYLKKQYNDSQTKGVWCSTNTFQIRGDPMKNVTYKLQTSILYELNIKLNPQINDFVNFSGTVKKNKVQSKKLTQQYEIDQFHLLICGKLLQQNQILLRQQIQSIFLAKSKQIAFKNRYIQSKEQENRKILMSQQFVKLRQQSNKIVQ